MSSIPSTPTLKPQAQIGVFTPQISEARSVCLLRELKILLTNDNGIDQQHLCSAAVTHFYLGLFWRFVSKCAFVCDFIFVVVHAYVHV